MLVREVFLYAGDWPDLVGLSARGEGATQERNGSWSDGNGVRRLAYRWGWRFKFVADDRVRR